MSRETMKAVYLPGASRVDVREIDRPTPGAGQVLVRIGASGICGSDLGYIYREHKTHKGLDGAPAYRGVVVGHEPAGTIVECGQGVASFVEGDRVIVYHIVGCGVCRNCRSGYFISCSDSGSRESYGWQRDGGHATWMVADVSTCIPLPPPLTETDGALIACGFGTAYEGLRRTGLDGRDELAIVGLGPVGLAAGIIGRLMGARRIIGAERNPERARIARELDIFDEVIDTSNDEYTAEHHGRYSVTMDCSGSQPGRSLALELVAEWGRTSLVGEGGTLETEVSDLILHKHLTIVGSWVTSLQGMTDVAQLLADAGVHPERIVTHRFPLAEAEEAYRVAAAGEGAKIVLIP